MTSTTTGFPSFAPGDHRHLLADVHRWARTNGWRAGGWRGYQNATFEDRATVTVRVNEAGLQVWRKANDAPHFAGQPTEYPADSVRQAIDLLVALDILPARFARAFRCGWLRGWSEAATDNMPATLPTNPDRRCRYCGATSGLILRPGNPLTGAGRAHECADGCKAADR